MKRFVSVILAVLMFCSAFSTLVYAEKKTACPYEWKDMEAILKRFNEYCEEYWVYASDEDSKAAFIEATEDVSMISARKYDFAVVRAKSFSYDDGWVHSWSKNDCPYYVIYESHENEWTVFAVVYVEGKVFTKVGYYNGAWYIDTSKYNVYWSK